MKKTLLFSNIVAMLCATAAIAQPLHQPIPNYTSDGTYNRTGHGSTIVSSPVGAFMEETVGGIAVDGNYHYLAHNSYANSTSVGVVLDKKNAANGTTVSTTVFNIGLQRGLAASDDRCRALLLDPSLNRAYICGRTNSDAFILCYDMTTMALVPGFGTNGIAIIEPGAEATGMILTGSGNNFVVAMNQGASILLKEYTSALTLVQSGTISLSGSTCVSRPNAFKKAFNGHYFIAGYARNASNVDSPMLWDCTRNAGSYSLVRSTDPVATGIGNGYFADFDFYFDPNPIKPLSYLFDIVAVGNSVGYNPMNTSSKGIYAKYTIRSTAIGFYVPTATFKNQATLPGTSAAFNNTATDIRFTRCSVGAGNYITVLGYHLSSNNDRAIMGYITPSGDRYYTTYLEQLPVAGGTLPRVHKAAGLARDLDGNVLISGCTMGYSYTITKLSDTYDCAPRVDTRNSSSIICLGDPALLDANIPTPNCTLEWRIISPGNTVIYSGLPASVQDYPNQTTVYHYTVVNTPTGCTTTGQITVDVVQCLIGAGTTQGTSSGNLQAIDDKSTTVSLYPNPNSGQFTLTTETSFTSDFTIYDLTGKQVQQIVPENNRKQSLNLSYLQPGVYFVKVAVDDVIQTIRFVIE